MTTRTPTITQFHRTSRRTLFALAALAALNVAAAPAVFAQAAPAEAAPAAAATSGDPPGRVARLDYMAGAVTTEPAGASDWSYAQLNRPLTTGDQLWNDANGRSELHIGSTAVRLGAQTSLDVLALDDRTAQLKVAQGTLSTRVRDVPPGTSYEIDTPNLALGVTSPGDYRVDVAPDGSTTTVTVRSGNLTVYGENGQMPMTAGQQIRFSGTGLQQVASNEAPPPDAFDQWALARDDAEDRSVSARYVSRDVPGYQDLDNNGTWRSDPQYGEVWTPASVPAGWAPYRDGHWVWQAPWGWTWVDDAPWGFAPYHYGRWAYVDDSWAWVPGPLVESAPPVYAPALVAFVGGADGGPDWGVDLAAGGVAAAGVAWFALGPGEPWHPHWGDWSPHYYDRVNQTIVVNHYRHDVNVRNTYVNYRVRGAVTAVPATAFVHGQPVSRFAQRVDPQQWRNARIEPGTPGIAPVKGSFGPNMRRADYRPPAALNQRQIVATRAPVAPPAFRDNLAQRFAHAGGTVPGAGAPVVRVAAPAHAPFSPFAAAAHGAWPAQNVRVVPPHSPVIGSASRPGDAPRMRPGQPGVTGGAPHPAPVTANAANAMQHGPERGQPGLPAAAQDHGVPRPPQFAGRTQGGVPAAGRPDPGAMNGLRDGVRQPAWTQPHTPMAMHGQPGRNEAGRPPTVAMQEPHDAARAQPQPQPQPQRMPEPVAEQHGPQMPQQAQAIRPAPQPEARPAFHPQAQTPRQDVRAQPQPRAELHPQPQIQPQPRQEFHPQPQPRAEFHPQPQPQPHPEFRPQPQPQPHAEFHPQPQPAPHPQERAGGGNHDDRHHG
ncbi:DUF6600 domain-containing protein [Paraburkholderia lycopersici]|uniref:FecR family protein n=1 Tax=Paraburkholderia lycopersici TaxID=416944 RepID=A0A1G6VJS6_9BURK|nr:DUF6600 domain-containing protein [Paraburkholderia lycopersici]SDD53643.1 hypothetical protein SAMN05421548_12131 [Paraburkholderia lycopersici]